MGTVPIKDADFIERRVADRYMVKMPKHLSVHDRWDVWERERFLSMESVLRHGDVLFDIGAESGEISAIYAQFVGAENMVLMEPAPEVWQTIRAVWEANELKTPRGTFCGLVGDVTAPATLANYSEGYKNGWPEVAFTEDIWTDRTFRYLHEHTHVSPQIRLDDFVEHSGIVPTAITIDVEGAEIRILSGAKQILEKYHPIVWASLHPDSAEANYGSPVSAVHELMSSLGYLPIHLATDHEEHFLYKPKEK